MYTFIVLLKKNIQKCSKDYYINIFREHVWSKKHAFQPDDVYKFETSEVITPYIIENLVKLMEELF